VRAQARWFVDHDGASCLDVLPPSVSRGTVEGNVLSGESAAVPESRDIGGDHGAPLLMTAPTRGVTEPKGDRMSRTDKTRPRWVKMADRPMVTCRPEHDHRFRPCTLPEQINADTAPIYRPTKGCYWVVTDQLASMVHNGCRECTGYYFRREDRRRSRHHARRELRAYHGED
jgi:hypothetical protein